MHKFLTPDFENAIKKIQSLKGRVIISGIGKSAIIGNKIVATLNSTGTPSIFMHAAEAIHGDLGIIQNDDIIILLSKSGNTPEIKNLVPFIKQRNEFATYFGKRTSNDGKINWNWQKERIYNWIRAQANPYPGAFTYNNGNKIVIDKIKYTEIGFTNEMSNGLVISTSPFLVKTPNGVVELSKVRKYDFEILKNSILI